MSKTNKSSYPKSTKTFRNDPLFYEELAILKAQESIAQLMKDNNTSKTELARMLDQSKSHITELLSDGRNLTLRTFARICFHLNAEVDFRTYSIGAQYRIKEGFSFNIGEFEKIPPISEKNKNILSSQFIQPYNINKNTYKTDDIPFFQRDTQLDDHAA